MTTGREFLIMMIGVAGMILIALILRSPAALPQSELHHSPGASTVGEPGQPGFACVVCLYTFADPSADGGQRNQVQCCNGGDRP